MKKLVHCVELCFFLYILYLQLFPGEFLSADKKADREQNKYFSAISVMM